jgi:hypothetical protein
MPRRFFIDPHKGVTFLVILGMMALFSQWQNATAWVYLALHGTYGILWVLKSRNFPDKKWEQPSLARPYYYSGLTCTGSPLPVELARGKPRPRSWHGHQPLRIWPSCITPLTCRNIRP